MSAPPASPGSGRSSPSRLPDLVLPPLILLSPGLNFLKSSDYGVLRPESLASLAILAAIGLAIGLGLSLVRDRVYRAVIIGVLVVFFVDLQLDWFDLEMAKGAGGMAAIALAAFVAGAALAFLVPAHVTRVAAVLGAAILVVTMLWPPARFQVEAATDGDPWAPGADLPLVVHLILDEQMATEAMPVRFGTGREVKRDLIDFYPANGFRLYGRTYSRYGRTQNSVPNMLNFTVSAVDRSYIHQEEGGFLVVKENAYFRGLLERGYKIHVYQTNYLDYCQTADVTVTTCSMFFGSHVNALKTLDLPVPKKGIIIASYVLGDAKSSIYNLLRATYSALRRRLAGSGTAQLPRWTRIAVEPQSGSVATLERLGEEIVSASRGHMFFAHLFLPHYPYAYDADCRLHASIGDWWSPLNPTARAPFINSPAARAEGYARYFEQNACLGKLLDRLFGRMKAAGVYDDAIIVIHGDHGSRIALLDADVRVRGLLSDDDYIDTFATLFAIKAPGTEAGYDRRLLPLQELFSAIVLGGWDGKPEVPVDEHFVWLRTVDGGAMERQPMPPFGAAKPESGD